MAGLDRLALAYGKVTLAQARGQLLLDRLAETQVGDIFDSGLHEFLTVFIREVGVLSGLVHDAYLSGEAR